MNGTNKKKISSFTKFTGAKSPPGKFILKRALMVSFLLISFLLAIGTASATSVVGDLQSGTQWNIYAYEGTAGGTNPCSGTGSSDSNTLIGGDLSYDDDDDYNVSWTLSSSPTDINIWFCDTGGNRKANFTKNVADTATVYVDLGRISGNTNNDLDNDYVTVCSDFNGTKLNSENAAVNSTLNNFTQYYAFEDGVAANESIYVFLDNDTTGPCIWDESKTTGRQIDTTSANAYENYGVAAEFGPEAKAQGYGHNDFDYGWMQIFNSYAGPDGNTDKLMIGMARFGDLGATEATRYTAYYDDTNTGSVYKVQVIRNTDASSAPTVTPDINILQVAAAFTSLDFNILVNGDMPTELDLVSTFIGTVDYQTTDISGTPADYNLYVTLSAAHTLQYWDAGAEKFQYLLSSLHNEDDTNADIGRVSGEAHSDLENATAAGIQVYKDMNCATEAENATGDPSHIVQPTNVDGSVDYNVYFRDDRRNDTTDASGQYHVKVWFKEGSTDYNTCGQQFALSSQAATMDLNWKVSGIIPYDQTRAVMVDLNKNGEMDLNTDDFNTAGNYFLFMTLDADANINVDNNVGSIVLTRNKNISSDTAFNVSRVYGDTHTELNDGGATDRLRIFSDSGCTTLASSAAEEPAVGEDPDYNIYFESQGAQDHFIGVNAGIGAENYLSCVRFTNAGNGQTNEYNIDTELTGQIPTGVAQVAVDTDLDGDYDSNTVSFSGADPDFLYYLYVQVDAGGVADANFLANDGNVLVKRNAGLSADETLDIARIWGIQHSDLQTATDVFKVYSDLEGQTELSSEDANVGNGFYTQYYEVPAAGATSAVLRVSDVVTNTYVFDANILAVVNLSAVVLPGDTDALHLSNRLVGKAPTDIKMIWATQWDPDTNAIWFSAEVNQADGNYRIFSASVADINISADEDFSQEDNGVNLSVIKDISAINYFNIDAIRGSVPWDFFGGTFETEDTSTDGACGGTWVGKLNSDDGGTDLVADGEYYDYQIYVDANAADYNVLFCDIGTNLLLNRYRTSSATGGVTMDLNIGKISGETLTELETAAGGTDDIQVFDLNNGILLSSKAVQPAPQDGVDYNVFFERFDGNVFYYLKAYSDQGGTGQFTSWIKVPWGGSDDINTVYNIATKLYGTYSVGVASAAVYLSGSSDWNAYSNDKPNGNEYQVYCATGLATDTAKFFAADNLGVTLLSYLANMTGDNNFHVARVTGSAHADLVEVANGGDNVEVYQSGISPCTTLLSSENITVEATYYQYYKSTTLVDANVFLKVVDRNGSYDYNTCLNTGALDANATSIAYDVDKKVGGYVATGLTNVTMDLGGADGVMDTNSNIVTGTTPDTYNIFSEGHATTDLNFLTGTSLELLKTENTTAAATLMFNVGKLSGLVHADLEDATNADNVKVYDGIGCSFGGDTELSSQAEQPVDGGVSIDFNQFFKASSTDLNTIGTTLYFVEYTYQNATDSYITCDKNGFTLLSLVNSKDASRKLSGAVPATGSGDPDVLSVGADINGSGQDNALTRVPAVDTDGYFLYLDSGASGTSDTVNFYYTNDGSASQVALTKTKNLDSDATVNVSLVYGETGTALEGGTDTIKVCGNGLPNDYTDTTCDWYFSSITDNPAANGGADYNVFFEQDSNTVYFLEIKDMNDFGGQTLGGSNTGFYSYHKFTSVAAGSRTDVDLNANLTGYLFEEYNMALPIADVNVSLLLLDDSDWNAFTFTNVDGNYVAYSMGPYDFQYTKAGHITRDYSTNAGEMNDIMLATVLDTNLLNGVIVTVHDNQGNAITDATVEVLSNTNPIVVLSGCTNTSTSVCTRTGDNTAGNGSTGKYYFSGFSLPQTIWVRAYKTGWETVVSPLADGAGTTVSTTTNYDITVYINDSASQGPTLIAPANGSYVSSLTPTLSWYDLGVDETDYNVQVATDAAFTSLAVDYNSNGASDTTYVVGENSESALVNGTLYYWRIAAVDYEGMGDWSDIRTFTVDTSAPTINGFSIDAGATYTTERSVTLEVNATGATYCAFSNYSDANWSPWYSYDDGNSYSWTLPSSTGTKTVYAMCKDDANNVVGPTSDTIIYDNTTPVNTMTLAGGATYTNTVNITMSYGSPDGATCYYSDNNGSDWNALGNCTGTQAIILNNDEGEKEIVFRSDDSAGNIGYTYDSIILDMAPPSKVEGTSAMRGGFNIIKVGWDTATDTPEAGGIGYYIIYRDTTDDFTVTDSKRIGSSNSIEFFDSNILSGVTYYYKVTAVDLAGNEDTETSTQATMSIDFVNPVVGSILINSGAIYTQDIHTTIALAAYDETGLANCWASNDFSDWNNLGTYETSEYWTLSAGDGIKTVYFRCTDTSDNNSVTINDTITFDGTSPSSPGPTSPSTAISTGPTATWKWTGSTDATSGVNHYNVVILKDAAAFMDVNVYSETFLTLSGLNEGTYAAVVTAVDNAGNQSSTMAFGGTFIVDITLPSATFTAPTVSADTNDVQPDFNFSVSDDGTVAECVVTPYINGAAQASVTTTPSGGNCGYTFGTRTNLDIVYIGVVVVDDANNRSDMVLSPIFMVDTGVPTVSITSPSSSTIFSDTTPQISFTAYESEVDESGLDWSRFIIDINGVTTAVDLTCSRTDSNIQFICDFNVPATAGTAFTDGSTENYISVTVADMAGNYSATDTVTDLNVDLTDYITLNSITAVTTGNRGQADDTNAHAWQWDFNIAIGIGSIGDDKNYVRFKLADWTSSTTSTTLYVDGNAEMVYDANVAGVQTTKVYNLQTTYDTTQTLWPMWDHDLTTVAIDANFYIQQRIPSSILSGEYSSSYGIKSYSS